MELQGSSNFREFLQAELGRRCARNQSYSQRAFARDLKLTPGRLSELLSGKHGLSRTRAGAIARCLSLNTEESEFFCDLVERDHGRSVTAKKMAAARLKKKARLKVSPIALDTFALISEWYHLAILELCQVEGFKSSRRWIASALRISATQSKTAVQRLVRLGMLREKNGVLQPTHQANHVGGGVPSAAIRAFHRHMLQKALSALEAQGCDERHFNTSVLAVPRAHVPAVKARIDAFWRELFQEFDGMKPKEEVYGLGIQWFRLSHIANSHQEKESSCGS